MIFVDIRVFLIARAKVGPALVEHKVNLQTYNSIQAGSEFLLGWACRSMLI